jgi:leucyl-tRNA synthetase
MENDQIIQRELEKEARLENLRKSVRIEATHDPDRLISQTQVWINKSFEIILYTTIV